MHDGSNYPNIKLKPWRGSRVRKFLKYLKIQRKTLKFKRDNPFISTGLFDKAQIHGRYIALQKLKDYIHASFKVKSLPKAVFNKKLFAGIRVAMVLEFIDYCISCNLDELNEIKNLVDDNEVNDYFRYYLLAQVEVYKDIHESILTGEFDDDDDDDEEDD